MPAVDVPFSSFTFPTTSTGALARSLPARLSDFVSVMDFGADPSANPSSDNRGAFEKAIVAATLSSKACGCVFVPRGWYNFQGPLALLPGFTPSTYNSFTIRGEAGGCTFLTGNFNAYILDTGEDEIGAGGFIVENLKLVNSNATPFTSGCIRMGGICPTVRSCWLNGMVGANFKGAKNAHISDTRCETSGAVFGGDPGVGNIGVVFAGDGGLADNCSFGSSDVAVAVSGRGIVINGGHVEVQRRAIVIGYDSEPTLGLGYCDAFVVQGFSGEGTGILIDVEGLSSGVIFAAGAQMHQNSGINPNGGTYPNRARWCIRVQDGCAKHITIFDVSGSTGDVIDPDGGAFYLGTPPAGMVRTGGCFVKGAFASFPNMGGSFNPWTLPGTAGGGAAVAGAANCAKGFIQGDFAPIWAYDDLPWGTLVGATISNGSGGAGTILSYSSATRLTLEVGAYVIDAAITPGTKVTEILSPTSATVDKSQNVSSGTRKFFCNNPGDSYQINDSVDPLWTGSVSNAGKPITTGGGSNRITSSFKETVGYVIVG